MRLLRKLEDVGVSPGLLGLHQEPHIGWAPGWGGHIRSVVCPSGGTWVK